MRLSSFLIQDKTFGILIQDKNLTECILKTKAHTKTARDFAVKNKQTNKFVFLSWRSRNTLNLKSKFKFQVFPGNQDRKTNSFVRFSREVRSWQFCFGIYWPLIIPIRICLWNTVNMLKAVDLQKVKKGDLHYPLMFHQADTSKAIIQCKDHESDIQSYPCIIEWNMYLSPLGALEFHSKIFLQFLKISLLRTLQIKLLMAANLLALSMWVSEYRSIG